VVATSPGPSLDCTKHRSSAVDMLFMFVRSSETSGKGASCRLGRPRKTKSVQITTIQFVYTVPKKIAAKVTEIRERLR